MGTQVGHFFRQLTFKPKPLPPDIRLDGQTAIITGASNGSLGSEAAKELASHGLARLILAVRNAAATSAEAAKQQIIEQGAESATTCDVQVWEVDYESFESMSAFAARARSELDRLDIVILCAGVKNLEFARAKTGHESNIQVNHLGTAYLSLLLLPSLRATAKKIGRPSRLTIVASEVHFWTSFSERHAPSILQRLDEESSFRGKGGMERYNTSKLLNVLWMCELSSRVAAAEVAFLSPLLASATSNDDRNERGGAANVPTVIINAVNPGFCASALHRSHAIPGQALINLVLAWTPAQGGHCLTDAACRHGDCQGAYISEQEVKSTSNFVTSAEGGRTQKKLWEETVAVFSDVDPSFDLGDLLEV
ncbi:hypothetical protein PG989_005455 [Apiospora arundinis]|uniref:NAD(P)-binding protein n=1 Tax=Apiospora arundinis TaxID=335852 RepID=A0ABR2IU45_9PEZI